MRYGTRTRRWRQAAVSWSSRLAVSRWWRRRTRPTAAATRTWRLLHDTVVQVGQRPGVAQMQWFQLDPLVHRQPDSLSQQHRRGMHQDLVDEARGQRLPGEFGAEQHDVVAFSGGEGSGDGFLDAA